VILHFSESRGGEGGGADIFSSRPQGGMIRPTFFGRENIEKEKDIVKKREKDEG
jgi:hypothetical protein